MRPTRLAPSSARRPLRGHGHKWLFSAPMSEFYGAGRRGAGAHLSYARFLPDGSRSDPPGAAQDSSATAPMIGEVEFFGPQPGVAASRGRGIADDMEMVAGPGSMRRLPRRLMRAGFAEAVHHVRHRAAFGQKLVDQPLMLRVLSDMALDLSAALALSLRLAEAYDMAEEQPAEAAYARLMNPVTKYWVCKSAAPFLAEAMGARRQRIREESALPRCPRRRGKRHWEGSGTSWRSTRCARSRGRRVDQVLGVIAKPRAGPRRASTVRQAAAWRRGPAGAHLTQQLR